MNKDLIYSFLCYDYVGAPWNWDKGDDINGVGGNGGFSLRRKSKMLEILETKKDIFRENNNWPEDVLFSTHIEVFRPSFNLAKLFSIEGYFSEITFGCHQPWGCENYNKLKELYPEVEILRHLQCEE